MNSHIGCCIPKAKVALLGLVLFMDFCDIVFRLVDWMLNFHRIDERFPCQHYIRVNFSFWNADSQVANLPSLTFVTFQNLCTLVDQPSQLNACNLSLFRHSRCIDYKFTMCYNCLRSNRHWHETQTGQCNDFAF